MIITLKLLGVPGTVINNGDDEIEEIKAGTIAAY
jgi:hypothetical protein